MAAKLDRPKNLNEWEVLLPRLSSGAPSYCPWITQHSKMTVKSGIRSSATLSIKLNLLPQSTMSPHKPIRPEAPNYYATSISLNPTYCAIPTSVLIFWFFWYKFRLGNSFLGRWKEISRGESELSGDIWPANGNGCENRNYTNSNGSPLTKMTSKDENKSHESC